MDNLSYFVSLLPKYTADIINSFDTVTRNNINEIRLRRNSPLILYVRDKPYFIDLSGVLTKAPSAHSVKPSSDDFDFVVDKLCSNSYHTKMSTLINGFVTAKNGSRIGVASTAVYKDGALHCIKDISSVNIRIAHEYKDCAKPVADIICRGALPSIIVAGSPGSGKTTFLRDYARLISNGYCGVSQKVSIIDERMELAGSFDVGINTDILSGFSKARGIEMATRTLSPELIVCDEIGSLGELDSIRLGFTSGVSFAVSVHISDERQILSNSIIADLIETNQFDYIVLLKSYTDEYKIFDLREVSLEKYRNDNDNPFYLLPWINGS